MCFTLFDADRTVLVRANHLHWNRFSDVTKTNVLLMLILCQILCQKCGHSIATHFSGRILHWDVLHTLEMTPLKGIISFTYPANAGRVRCPLCWILLLILFVLWKKIGGTWDFFSFLLGKYILLWSLGYGTKIFHHNIWYLYLRFSFPMYLKQLWLVSISHSNKFLAVDISSKRTWQYAVALSLESTMLYYVHFQDVLSDMISLKCPKTLYCILLLDHIYIMSSTISAGPIFYWIYLREIIDKHMWAMVTVYFRFYTR